MKKQRQALKDIEKTLTSIRGSVFTPPPKDTPVILMLSGGVDSIALWHILLSKLHLQVYPVAPIPNTFGTRSFDPNYQAIQFFSRRFGQEFPDQFHQPYFTSDQGGNTAIAQDIVQTAQTKPEGASQFIQETQGYHFLIIPQPDIVSGLAAIGVNYSQLLQLQLDDEVNTIFFGFVPTDQQFAPAESLISLRSITLHYATIFNQDIQITSPYLEKMKGIPQTKKQILKYYQRHSLPIEKTWSCTGKARLQCGQCVGCTERRFQMHDAGVSDPTKYQHMELEPYDQT